MRKLTMAAGAMVVALAGLTMPAMAQGGREVQLINLNLQCNRGDRAACVRFGMLLQQNADRHAELRRTHPEFFFFER